MSEYSAQVEAAVARLKTSNSDATFKALLRDVSDIVRSILSGCRGSYDYNQWSPKRIELTKLNRENQATDDLKTLLLALGFDDDHQRPSCMVITHVNANVLGTFLDETARILQHVEGLTTSAFPTTDWPAAVTDEKLQREDYWEPLADDHPQMRVLARYYADRHSTVSPTDDSFKIAAVFSFYFCTVFVSLPIFLQYLHSCGPVDRLCRWLRVAKEQIDTSAVLLSLLLSSTPQRSHFEKTMRKVENFAQYTAFVPNFKEDFQVIQEDANGLLLELKKEMEKSSTLGLIFRYSYNLSRLISRVTPVTIFMPLHAPNISGDCVRSFCRSAREIKLHVSADYQATVDETCTFLSKHEERLAYDELSSLLIKLAENLIDSMRSSATVEASTAVPADYYPCSEGTEQPPADSERMVRMLGTATDVDVDVTGRDNVMCTEALHLGISQKEYEEAFYRQLDVDTEDQPQNHVKRSEATPPVPPSLVQPIAHQRHTANRCDQAEDDVTTKTAREVYTASNVPLAWPEDDSGLATCEQSSQQVSDDSDGQETVCDRNEGNLARQIGSSLQRAETAATGQTSHKRQHEDQKIRRRQVEESGSCSSAAQNFTEIIQAAPEAFSLAQKATQDKLEEEIGKKNELEQLLNSPTSQPLPRARDELQKGIQTITYKIASLQENVQRWKRLFAIARSLTKQKKEKSVADTETQNTLAT